MIINAGKVKRMPIPMEIYPTFLMISRLQVIGAVLSVINLEYISGELQLVKRRGDA